MLKKSSDGETRECAAFKRQSVEGCWGSTTFWGFRVSGVGPASPLAAPPVKGAQALALVQAAWRSLNSSVVEAVRKGRRARWRHGRAWPLTTSPTGLGACQTRGKSTPMEACRSAPAGVWWELGDGRSGRPQPRRREAPCQKPGTAPPAPPIWRSGQEGILSCLGRPRRPRGHERPTLSHGL